jgi:hypothetical protein
MTRRRTRSVLRAVIPLLALVWTSLPLHHCNLAFAATAAAPVQPHCHQLAEGTQADASQSPPADAQASPAGVLSAKALAGKAPVGNAKVSCSDLGRAGPDLRPAVAVDAAVVHVSFDAGWHDRAELAGQAVALRPHDDGRWRIRPLHLRNATLLI